MGLITDILQKTPPKKPPEGSYTMNPKLLKSRSDIAAFNEMVEIEAKKKRGERITKAEAKGYKDAIRKLVNRGIMTRKTEEEDG